MPTYDVLVPGSNLRLKDDFLGISSVVLVEGRAGPMLFDTGGFVSRMGLLKALRVRGLEPRDIGTVFLSHLHHDHVHNIDLFSHARFVASRWEWDYAGAPHPDDIFVQWGIREQLSRSIVELVEGEGEIEPGIAFFPAPGHTPGLTAWNCGPTSMAP